MNTTMRGGTVLQRMSSLLSRMPRASRWVIVGLVAACVLSMPFFTDLFLQVCQNLVDEGSLDGGIWGFLQQALGYLVLPVLFVLSFIYGVLAGAVQFAIYLAVFGIVIFVWIWLRRRVSKIRHRSS
ncbi:hypothetical protein [Rhodococcus qingshengii]|uniref:hypothetical protein n=1 Tax=Rhodococcus qingshengii TaxID=334542 RepID=UPI00237CD8E0|nr:hypothetical protein [Rhodococcus qingshengii]WCT06133.1 hypothetical protein PI247_31540 [Rhodococcus qingshengii]